MRSLRLSKKSEYDHGRVLAQDRVKPDINKEYILEVRLKALDLEIHKIKLESVQGRLDIALKCLNILDRITSD